MNISFDYVFPTGPSISNVLHYTPTNLVFNGYFRVESELPTSDRPIHRILYIENGFALIAITALKRGEDTSEYWTDEEEGQICLTPTEIIELTYHVLEFPLSSKRYNEVLEQIMEEEKDVRKRNEDAYNARREKEMTGWKQKQ
jgi:hypothetical protein